MRLRASTKTSIACCVLSLIAISGGGFATTLSAQSPAVGSDRLGWTQAASAEEMAQLTFALFLDGTRQAVTANCSPAASGYDCLASFPAMTPGQHTLELVAIRTMGTEVLESARSAPLSVTFVVVPNAPASLRVVKP